MEETIRHSEERYRTILDEIEDGYFEVDLAGNYTFVNDAICRHLKYSREDLIGKSFRVALAKEEFDKIYKAFGNIYLTGKPKRGIFYKAIRKDGTTGTVEIAGFPLKNQKGDVIGFRGMARDITDRRQMEEALRQSEEKHRVIIENIQDGYFEVDLAGNFTFFNESICEIQGYSKEELMGMNHRQYADKENSKKVFDAFNEIYKTGIAGSIFDYEIIRKDGTRRQVEASASLQKDTSGTPIGFRGTTRDITERKQAEETIRQSEERYRTILDEMEDAYFEVGLAGNFTFVNDAVCRHLGYSREELLGANFRGQMAEEEIGKVYNVFNNIYNTGKPGRNISYKVIRKDGTTAFAEIAGLPLQNRQGEIIGFRGIGQDITERKRAVDKLVEHRSRLEAIFSSVKDAIITINQEYLVIEANKSTETICGTPVKKIAGNNFTHCQLHCSKACHEVLMETVKQKTAIKEHRIECMHKQRPNQVVSVSSSPLLDSDDNFMGAVLVIRDITLLRDMERELRERNNFQDMIGRNKTMQDIYNLLEDLADLDTTVLVTGESGTGKELVARALHYSGNRSFKPFITVSCSALAESLLESELFGHVKGAFTGAIKDKYGRFQAADGGTILLDEIGDISPLIQLKLLRVLQEKEFERVGESIPRKVDVRVITTTNKDLKEKVKKGEFRQDLYYRLKVVEVPLPPLRERLEDLPLLVDHFRRSFNERFKKNVEGISSEVLNTFMNYSWPGNVRELEHVMEHAFVLCHGLTITMHHLPADMSHHKESGAKLPSNLQLKTLTGVEDVLNTINKTGGNKAKAARLLGISRRTLYRRINDDKTQTNNNM